MKSDQRPVLHICLTCQPNGTDPSASGKDPAGTRLHAAIEDRLASRGLEGEIRTNPITCMANCEQGCSVALSAKGKWAYLAGYLTPDLADDLIDYALVYGTSKTGVVMPSKRAPSLKDVIVARVPAHPDDLADLARFGDSA